MPSVMTPGNPTGIGPALYSPSKFFVPALVQQPIPASGNLFTQTFNAVMANFSGTLAKSSQIVISASTSLFQGTLAKQTADALAGTLGFIASTAKQTGNSLAASLGFAGSVVKQIGVSVVGTLGVSGSLVKQIGDVFSGAMSFAVSMVRQSGVAVSGVMGFAGAAFKQIGVPINASMQTMNSTIAHIHVFLITISASMASFAGTLVKSINSQGYTSASLGVSGSFLKQTGNSLTASFGFAGSTAKQIGRSFSASMTVAGALVANKVTTTVKNLLMLMGVGT